jgi:N-carbamoyl-L-amino-acid hydrolase
MTTEPDLPAATAVTGLTDEDFLADFHHTTVYGATAAGGIDRQAGTAEHGAVRAWFRARAEALGMTVTVDGIGNQYATYRWLPDGPTVLTGSHLDSQPLGGRFDGTYGVITALHAAARLNDEVRAGRLDPVHNLTVVDWFNEEGARFAPSIMGSSAMVGIKDRDEMLAVTDVDGVTVRQALESIGCLGTDAAPDVAAYAEIHIEQGRLLERNHTTIGAVTQSWYTRKLVVTVKGEQSHTGATVMADRHDALVAAAKIVVFTEDVVADYETGEDRHLRRPVHRPPEFADRRAPRGRPRHRPAGLGGRGRPVRPGHPERGRSPTSPPSGTSVSTSRTSTSATSSTTRSTGWSSPRKPPPTPG